MKFLVILLSLLQFSVAEAAPKKLAKLPTYTPNNPYGKWTALPNGKNYLFCGDRIIYGTSFNEKIKIQYNGEDRLLTIREHCEMRRRELERAVATRTSEEPSLIQLQYEKLAGHLKKIPGGTKAGRAYSLKEIRKAMKANELNDLRAANLMLPVLTEPEFSKLYAGETNNPQFTKTEHERYVSNLMTQNPAMLYTANGSLYYFSLNLSNDQLKLLASVVGSGGGGGGAGSSGGSGGRSGGSAGNSESGNSRRPLANALEGARQNPFEGSKLSSNLNVKPQATTLPASFGVDSDATFVPYDMKMPSVSFGPTRGVASSGSSRGSNDRVKAVTVSSNPSLGMMNIGGMGRSGSSGGGSSSGGGTSTSSSSNSSSPSSSGNNSSYKSTTTSPPSSGVSDRMRTISGTAESAINSRTGSGAAIDKNTKNLIEDLVDGLPRSLNSPSGPVDIKFAGINHDITPFAEPDYSCKPNKWEQTLYHLNSGNTEIQNSCYPFENSQILNSKFCGISGSGMLYTNECVYNKDSNGKLEIPEGVLSCYDQIMVDVGNICKKYLEMPEPFNHDSLVRCAETMFALTCDKIPCDIEPIINKDANGKNVISALSIQGIENSAIFKKQELPKTRGQQAESVIAIKNFSEIIKIQYVAMPSAENEPIRLREAPGTKVNLKNELKEEFFKPTLKKEDYTKDMVSLNLFYQSQMQNKCQFENKTYRSTGSPSKGSN